MATTTQHKCNKEVELTEMHADIKYIKKALSGNGEPGLIHEVNENKEFRIATQAKNSLIKVAVGSGWLITIATLIMYILGG